MKAKMARDRSFSNNRCSQKKLKGYSNLSHAYVVITPVRDEERHIGKTIESMTRQSLLPKNWIIVDDGSTDRTPEILYNKSKKFPWITVIYRRNRGFRVSGSGVIEAFYEGYAVLKNEKWDYLVKLDGDLSFRHDYFERCIGQFMGNKNLGIGGGAVYVIDEGELKIDSEGDPPFHVRGATKIYRRACWNKISPLINAPGWDTIDEVKANMYGWKTETFYNIPIIQLKATGSADGRWKNWIKNGLANYIAGYHPIFMLGKCFKRAFGKRHFKASAALWIGFCMGYYRGIPREQNRHAVSYLRHQQLRYLMFLPSIYR